MTNRIATSLNDLDHADARLLMGNRAYSKAGLADHATAHEDVLTTAAAVYSIGGVMYSKAAVAQIDLSALAVLDETGTAKPLVAQAAGATRIYLLALDSAGAIAIIQATGLTASSSGNQCPGCPPNYAPFGAIKIANNTASAFTLGTTSKTTANITATYYDLSCAPATL
jgi:hypothetical protein